MPHLWIHLGLPAILCLVIYLTEARSVRHDVRRAEVSHRRALIRRLEAIERDQVRIVGKIVSPDGEAVNLGTSTEKPDSISGNPVLEGEPVVIEAADGRRYRLRPDSIIIQRLPGAERKLVRTVTTDDGVEQTYSFEVPDGFELMVLGTVSASTKGAFREGLIDLMPLESGYRIGEDLFDERRVPTMPKVDTDKNASLVAGLFALFAVGLGFIPYVGALAWYPAMVVLALGIFAFAFGSTTVEPLRPEEEAKLEALQVRVEIPETEAVLAEESDRERAEAEA